MDDPRYPIGRFVAPTSWDAAEVTAARRTLAALPEELRVAVSGLGDVALDTPYREGGWTVRQLVHHVADSHLNAYVRCKLAVAERHPTIRPYDQDAWAQLPESTQQAVEPSLLLLEGLHLRWGALFDALDAAGWERTFLHPEYNKSFTLVHTLGLYAWHGQHHTAQIRAARIREGW